MNEIHVTTKYDLFTRKSNLLFNFNNHKIGHFIIFCHCLFTKCVGILWTKLQFLK